MAKAWLEDKATWLFDLAHDNLDEDAIVKGFLKHYRERENHPPVPPLKGGTALR